MSVLHTLHRNIINEFSKLPGVGPKSSARMVYHFFDLVTMMLQS